MTTGPAWTTAERNRFGPGTPMFAVALVVLFWDLGRPAFWIDEGASVAATRRSWPQLWFLERGPDAPLVPFYAVLKVLTGVSTKLAPHLTAHPEVLYRWPSTVAMSAAVGLLVAWVNRYGGVRLALASGFLMLLTAGISRYAQEARAYAITLLLAVVATWLWSHVVHDQKRRWQAGYALSIAALVTLQTLAAALVVAHLVASLLVRPRGGRRSAVIDTGIAAAGGLLLAAPQAVAAIRNGAGAKGFQSLTVTHGVEAFTGLFGGRGGGRSILPAAIILLLAVIGMASLPSAPDQFLARTAACWALIPPVLLLVAVMKRPNLLIGRYVLFAVPAWSVLAGLGALAVIDLPQRTPLLRNIFAWRPVSWMLAAVLAAGVVTAELPALAQVRGRAGHGEDVRPLVALINQAPFRALPIVMAPGLGAAEFEAYDPAAAGRVIDLSHQDQFPVVWPVMLPPPVRREALARTSGFIVLLHTRSGTTCAPDGEITTRRIRACLGLTWDYQVHRVVATRRAGREWSMVVLQNEKPSAGPGVSGL